MLPKNWQLPPSQPLGLLAWAVRARKAVVRRVVRCIVGGDASFYFDWKVVGLGRCALNWQQAGDGRCLYNLYLRLMLSTIKNG